MHTHRHEQPVEFDFGADPVDVPDIVFLAVMVLSITGALVAIALLLAVEAGLI